MDEMKFQKLTPKQDVDLGDYEKAFDFIFEENDITNVAVSGAYSSGKSSLVESYEKKHEKIKFMHISLAHFEDEIDQENEELDSEGVIEGKILNQLIQQIPSEEIPLTNFRVKKKARKKAGIWITVLFGVFLLLMILCLKFWDLDSFVTGLDSSWFKVCMQWLLMPELRFVYGNGALVIFLIGVYECVSIQQNRNVFKRLNFQGNEIEIFEESNESYFDKYLNEVLYLFENSGVDAIVFEDIDRFDSVRIFERLREINTLTNIRLKSNGKSIRFFYLLRDDIFQTKDRTKFFDFIIPVVPVLDSSNSYNKTKEYLESVGIYQKFNDHFLRGLSLYIDDLRLLKNIFNEFLLYHSKLSNIELDVNKLFAILTYKNLFPKDFAELQLNRGFVFNLFDSRESLIKERSQELVKKREEIQKQIEQREKDNLQSEYELTLIKNANKYNWSPYFTDSTEFNKWNNGISERLERFQNPEYKLEKLKEELAKINSQIENILSLSLSELLDREHIDDAFKVTYTDENGKVSDFAEIKGNPYFGLLKYLLSRGYIDDTYLDYMSYFYDNSLTINDKNFLRSVTDRIGKDASYSIDNCQLVLESLDEHDFKEPETRNYALIKFLLSDSYRRKLHARSISNFFESLAVDDIDNAFSFINGYLNTSAVLPEFTKALTHYYPEVLSDAVEYEQMDYEQLKKFVLLVLSYCEQADLSASWNDIVSEYVSENAQILDINENVFGKCRQNIIHTLKQVAVAYKALSLPIDAVLLRGIYENNLYVLNENNIRLLLCEYQGADNADWIISTFGDFALDHPEEPLVQYVSLNKNEFSKAYLEFYEGEIADRSESIVAILNDTEIDTSFRNEYISRLQNKVESLKAISATEFWKQLILKDAVEYSIENVLTYFLKYKLSSELVAFLNGHQAELHYKEYSDQSCVSNFGIAVLNCNELSTDKFRQIVAENVLPRNSFNVTGLSFEKIGVLINLKIIEMTNQNLSFIRNNYTDNLMDFIFSNIGAYLTMLSSYDFEMSEIEAILANDEVTFDLKEKLLDTISISLGVMGKSYSDEVVLLILKKYLKTNEIPDYLKEYDGFSQAVQKQLVRVFADNVTTVENYKDNVTEALLIDIVESAELSEDEKEVFFNIYADVLSEKLLEMFLTALNVPKIVGNLFKDDKSHVEVNDKDDRIIETLHGAKRIDAPVKMNDKFYKKLRLKRKANISLPNELL